MTNFRFRDTLQLTFTYFKKVFMHFTIFSMVILTLVFISNSFHPYAGLLFQFAIWPLLLAGYYLFLMGSLKHPTPPFSSFFHASQFFIPIVMINAFKLIFITIVLYPYTLKYGTLLQEFVNTRNVDLQIEIINSLSRAEFLIGLLGTVLLLYFMSLAIPYAIFHQLTPIKAITKSFITNFNIFTKGFLFYILLLALSGFGILFFGVGIFVTLGIYFCGIFAIFITLHTEPEEILEDDSTTSEIRIEEY